MPNRKASKKDAMEGRVAGLESSMRERNVRGTENDQLSRNSRKSLLNSSTFDEFKLAARKVELPMFEGVDPVVGDQVPDLDWEKFKQALIVRYSGRKLSNPYEILSTLRQSGSVDDYIEVFEEIEAQVPPLTEAQYMGYFMGGLREDIRRAIRLHKPTDRIRLLELARDVEDALLGGGYPSSTGYRSKSRSEGLSGMKGNSSQVERNLFSSEEGRGIVGMKDSRQLQRPEHKVGSGGDVADKDRKL
ncbi:Retrotransposon gag domain [Sesbania bispinosa]|nr:Retrotransposon gag domain [Sesbania bispinosa]